MKLAIVTAYPPSRVTLNEYGYYLIKHFRQHREVAEILLLCDQADEEQTVSFPEDGCKVTVRPCWKFNDPFNAIKIHKVIREEQPDAVFLNLQFLKFGDRKVAAALGLTLPLLCRFSGFPVITLLHNILEQVDLDEAGFTKNPLLQKIYQGIGYGLTRLVLASDMVAVTISKYQHILRKKYRVQHVGLVPHGSFETPPEPSYELPDGPLQVMAFGKFGTYKKVEVMIEAAEKVRQRTGLPIEVVVAGTDSPNTPGYLDGVAKKYAHITNLRFTGYVAEEDVPRIFNESAVVVFPYTSTTGSSGVLHQAGSYGKAVILPDLGDLGILVREEGYRGEFFEPNSSDSLATGLERILGDQAYRNQLEKANYNAACSLPMSEITARYLQHFKAILSKKGKITPPLLKEVPHYT